MVSLPHIKVSSSKPYPIAHCVTCNKFFDVHKCYLATVDKVIKLRFFHEVVNDPKWREAMAKEIEALEEKNTWSVEELPPWQKPIN